MRVCHPASPRVRVLLRGETVHGVGVELELVQHRVWKIRVRDRLTLLHYRLLRPLVTRDSLTVAVLLVAAADLPVDPLLAETTLHVTISAFSYDVAAADAGLPAPSNRTDTCSSMSMRITRLGL